MARTSKKSRYGDRTTVFVVSYDPAWAVRFEQEHALIADALGDLALAIDHVGSTAVTDLAAKPIVDIMVGVRRIEDGERFIEPLDNVGYEYRGDGGFPAHLFWRKGDPRLVNLHMVEHENDFWQEHIAFRNALRASPMLAEEYGTLKRRVAQQYSSDKVAYNNAKEPFIRRVLDRLANG